MHELSMCYCPGCRVPILIDPAGMTFCFHCGYDLSFLAPRYGWDTRSYMHKVQVGDLLPASGLGLRPYFGVDKNRSLGDASLSQGDMGGSNFHSGGLESFSNSSSGVEEAASSTSSSQNFYVPGSSSSTTSSGVASSLGSSNFSVGDTSSSGSSHQSVYLSISSSSSSSSDAASPPESFVEGGSESPTGCSSTSSSDTGCVLESSCSTTASSFSLPEVVGQVNEVDRLKRKEKGLDSLAFAAGLGDRPRKKVLRFSDEFSDFSATPLIEEKKHVRKEKRPAAVVHTVDFPTVLRGKKDTERVPIVLHDLETFLGNEGDLGWRHLWSLTHEARNSRSEPDLIFEGALEKLTVMVNEFAGTPENLDSFVCLSSQAKKMGEKYNQVHSPGCIIQLTKNDDSYTLCAMELPDGTPIELVTTYSCCKGLWAEGFTPRAFLASKFHWATTILLKHKENGVDPACTARFKRAMEEQPFFRQVHSQGLCLVKAGQFPVSSPPGFWETWIDKTLVRYGKLSSTGIPAFKAITDRKHAFQHDHVVANFPLLDSARLQLYLSEEWVKETLPGAWESLCELMGARGLVFSLLYSEGVNYLRSQKDFQEEVKKAGKVIPEAPLTVELVEELVGSSLAQNFFENLRQTAHKDTVLGYFSDVPEYQPTQVVLGLEGTSTIYAWVDGEGKGLLQHHTTRAQWRKNEVSKGYGMKKFTLDPGDALFFHAKQTHAGAGLASNFRIFVGSVPTPESWSIESHHQSYFEMGDADFGGYRQISSYISADEDHTDRNQPDHEKWFRASGWSAPPLWNTRSIKIPAKGRQFLFYKRVLSAWERENARVKSYLVIEQSSQRAREAPNSLDE